MARVPVCLGIAIPAIPVQRSFSGPPPPMSCSTKIIFRPPCLVAQKSFSGPSPPCLALQKSFLGPPPDVLLYKNHFQDPPPHVLHYKNHFQDLPPLSCPAPAPAPATPAPPDVPLSLCPFSYSHQRSGDAFAARPCGVPTPLPYQREGLAIPPHIGADLQHTHCYTPAPSLSRRAGLFWTLPSLSHRMPVFVCALNVVTFDHHLAVPFIFCLLRRKAILPR